MASTDVNFGNPGATLYGPSPGEGDDFFEARGHRIPSAASRRQFPLLEAGQLVRALLLIAICLGLFQLPRPERAHAVSAVATQKAM